MSETSEPELSRRSRRRLWPRTRRGQVIAVAVLVLVLTAAATGTWYLVAGGGQNQVSAIATRTVEITPTTLKSTITASGTLSPKRQADLAFDTSSTVTSVKVSVGDSVKKGQTLATIDDASLQIAYDSARADLTAARETLADLGDSSDSSDAALKAATASVQVKKNAVTTARANLAAATMTAPFAGLIAQVNIVEGDTTGSSSGSAGAASGAGGAGGGTSSSSTSSSAIVLISKDRYTVSTTVSSSDIAKVKTGLQAELAVDGSSDTLYGTVTSVAVTASSSSSGTASFPVTIALTGAQEGLFAGSSVTASIIVKQLTDVIAVPAAAITTTDGSTTVQKLVDGVATATQVTTGETIDNTVVITEGLAEGDEIQVTVTTPGGGDRTGSSTSENRDGFPTDGQLPNFGAQGGGEPPAGAPGMGGGSGMGGGPNR